MLVQHSDLRGCFANMLLCFTNVEQSYDLWIRKILKFKNTHYNLIKNYNINYDTNSVFNFEVWLVFLS